MERRFVRVTHGDEADMNKALEDQAAEGWELEQAFPAAGDVVLLFRSSGKPAEETRQESS